MLYDCLEHWSLYRHSRFPATLYVPLALLLWLAGRMTGPWPSAGCVLDLALALTLLLQFRLWDDLADRDRDRREHPERLLCQLASVRHFGLLVGILAVVNLLLIAVRRPGAACGLYVILSGFFALWYGCRRRLRVPLSVDAPAVLSKYPAFVYILADPPTPGWQVLVLVYLGFSVYEVGHDARLRSCFSS